MTGPIVNYHQGARVVKPCIVVSIPSTRKKIKPKQLLNVRQREIDFERAAEKARGRFGLVRCTTPMFSITKDGLKKTRQMSNLEVATMF